MTAVEFLPLGSVADEDVRCAVTAARYRGGLLFVRRRDCATLELPGGRREPGEAPLAAARRELCEETGAVSFDLTPVCFSVATLPGGRQTVGLVCRAEVHELGPLPESEIAEVVLCPACPGNLTYPGIHPFVLERACAGETAE